MSTRLKISRVKPIIYLFIPLSLLFNQIVAAKTSPQTKYNDIVQRIANKHRLKSTLIHSIIKAESNYDRFAVSPKGAQGLMQLMPATARQYGVKDPFDPKQNIEGGVRYLKDLIKLFNGKTNLVLAAYNAGQEAVKKYSGIPPYRETRRYVEKVMAAYGRPTITTRSKIYRFVDKSGRTVLTNDYMYYKSQIAARDR